MLLLLGLPEEGAALLLCRGRGGRASPEKTPRRFLLPSAEERRRLLRLRGRSRSAKEPSRLLGLGGWRRGSKGTRFRSLRTAAAEQAAGLLWLLGAPEETPALLRLR